MRRAVSMTSVFRATAAAVLLSTQACTPIPETGEGTSRADRPVRAFMQRWNVPGLALAVVADGRLVLARGYGYADPAAGEPMQPDSLFRIASASKPVTAIAVMKLVEEERLGLDDAVFSSILPGYARRCPDGVDTRLHDITVEHLLTHASGWDTGEAPDPMFNAALIARQRPVEGLRPVQAVIQDQACRPLEFTPGTRQVYENLNYAVLGRVVEAVAGVPYEQFVREQVFAPLGITAPRIGKDLISGRLFGEVTYVARGDDRRRVRPASGPAANEVPLQYGGFLLSAMDSHGGWVASAVDLARLMTGVDGRPGVPDLLAPGTIARMGASPGPPLVSRGARLWYALGWYRTRAGAWFHDGSLPGSASFMRIEPDGILVAAAVNTRHTNPEFAADFRATIRRAAAGVRHEGRRDLFPRYGYPPAVPR